MNHLLIQNISKIQVKIDGLIKINMDIELCSNYSFGNNHKGSIMYTPYDESCPAGLTQVVKDNFGLEDGEIIGLALNKLFKVIFYFK